MDNIIDDFINNQDEISQKLINMKFNKTISIITFVLNIYLNIEQNLTINSKQMEFSLEKTMRKSLKNQTIEFFNKNRFKIPFNFNSIENDNEFILLRVSLNNHLI